MAGQPGPDARVVLRELVLQRLAERPAAARARDEPGRGEPRRDPAPGSERARLACRQSGMKLVPVLVVALVPASLALATAFGSVDLGPGQLADALLGRGDEIAREIIWGVRAPRALAAFACGGLLALAGALLQVLLRNPLADPTILGVSGGAAAGALAAMLLGVGAAGLNLAALARASVAAGARLALSPRPPRGGPFPRGLPPPCAPLAVRRA